MSVDDGFTCALCGTTWRDRADRIVCCDQWFSGVDDGRN